MSYIGQGLPADTFQGFVTDSFTGDGSATTFTLSKEPFSEDTLIVVINNVIQKPTTNFTVSGTTLTIVGTAVASGDVIYAIHMGGPLPIGGASELDLNGASDKLVLDADADTTISADTDDQIDFKAGGTDIMSLTATTVTINDGTTITTADNTDTLTLTSTDADANVGPNLRLYRNSSSPADSDYNGAIQWEWRNDNSQDVVGAEIQSFTRDASDGTEDNILWFQNMTGGTLTEFLRFDTQSDQALITFNENSNDIDFRVESNGNGNMFKVDAGEDVVFFSQVATTTPGYGNTTIGGVIKSNGVFHASANGNPSGFNRSNDGSVLAFSSAGQTEGFVDISGSTVSYGAFTGSHWSRLADNSKPTILRGTIMESLDEMCDWYFAESGEIKVPIALPNGKSVGDAVTFTVEGVEYTGVYKKENDIKHVKSKISDTADSKKVYGVFANWDDQDDGLDGDVNDLNIAQVGTFIIRVNKDVTVSAGDLLVSNGDGTAKKQDDDIIRSKTVAKVNSNIKVETYSDGSYTVPCTLHC